MTEGANPPILGKEGMPMTVFESLYLMMSFGMLIIAAFAYTKK